MDFLDVSIYLKEKGIAPKLGLLAEGGSGGVTAMTSLMREPCLFDTATVHVTFDTLNVIVRTVSMTCSLTSKMMLH